MSLDMWVEIGQSDIHCQKKVSTTLHSVSTTTKPHGQEAPAMEQSPLGHRMSSPHHQHIRKRLLIFLLQIAREVRDGFKRGENMGIYLYFSNAIAVGNKRKLVNQPIPNVFGIQKQAISIMNCLSLGITSLALLEIFFYTYFDFREYYHTLFQTTFA